MSAAGIVRTGAIEPCFPWPRHILTPDGWRNLAAALVDDPLPLLVSWADTTHVHALFLEAAADAALLASVPVEAGTYPALSPVRPGAAWYERMIRDLWGHEAAGGTDQRPWLDHGQWVATRPMSLRPGPPVTGPEPPEFRTEGGAAAMQLPIGPVWGCLEEPAHLRLTMEGTRIVRAEARLGYAYRGILTLMRGKPVRAAARFVARLSGDCTVAHSMAFATAAEAALQVTVPPRATVLRAMMMEVERVAGHLNELSALAGLADLGRAQARLGEAREVMARAAGVAFGHRLMMDCVVPGGVIAETTPAGVGALRAAIGSALAALDAVAPLAARLHGLGRTTAGDVLTFAAGGVTGRAANRNFDARDVQSGREPAASRRTRTEGDAAARCQLRAEEIGNALARLRRLTSEEPGGAISAVLPAASGEGVGCAESIRGDIWHWLRLDHGQIAAVFPRDPGWALWPLAERVLAGGDVADQALIRRSLGLPASGMDL